jgi:hypothetical protein
MSKVLRNLGVGKDAQFKKGSEGPDDRSLGIVRRYKRDAYISMVGFGVIAADLAYAAVTSGFGLAKLFVEGLFILAGFGGVAMLWVSAYLTSKLINDLRDEDGKWPAASGADS